MNVFVLCTGRCGSTTFTRACSHITNYTAGHESRAGRIGPDRFAYSDNHIEADNRLCWLLGRLDQHYGDDAWYVHLVRDSRRVAESFCHRFGIPGGIASAYRDAILGNRDLAPIQAATDYVHTVNANIGFFLRDKTKVMNIAVERAEQDFPIFWRWIGAQGSLADAMGEWRIRYNSRPPRSSRARMIREAAALIARAASAR